MDAGTAPAADAGGEEKVRVPEGMKSARLSFTAPVSPGGAVVELLGAGGRKLAEVAIDPGGPEGEIYLDLPPGEGIAFRGPAGTRLAGLVCFDRPLADRVDLRDPASFAGRTDRFLNLRIDLNNSCNLQCRMCYVRNQRPRSVRFPIESFRALAKTVFPRTRLLFLSCGFEPTANPDFAEVLETVGSYGIPRTGFATNGLLFDERLARRAIESRISHILFSLDGARRKTYEAIRAGSSFERVIGNIRALNRMKAERGVAYPKVYVNFVLMKRNLKEMPAMVPLAASLEASYLSVASLEVYEGLGMEDERVDLESEEARYLLDWTLGLGERWGLNVFVPPHRPAGRAQATGQPLGERFERWKLGAKRRIRRGKRSDRPAAGGSALEGADIENCPVGAYTEPIPDGEGGVVETPCVYPWFQAVIQATGNAVPCCFWHDPVPLGNVLESPFEEVFDSRAYRRLRAELRTGELRDLCRRCGGKTHPDHFGRPQGERVLVLG